jgi:hypothetical protein
MEKTDKTAYVSPPHGVLELAIIRDANPRVTLALDLGIPNFTVFSMNFPLAEGEPRAMSELIAEAVNVLLDEVASFMIAQQYEEPVIVKIYQTVLSAFKSMSTEADTAKDQDVAGQDPTVQIYEGTFDIPMDFINATQQHVVTGGVKKIKREPKVRHIELTYSPKQKTKPSDSARVIRQYRNRSLKQQPKPMFVIVYDQLGRPTGTIPIGTGKQFKNQLLKMLKKGSVDFTAPVSYTNEQEMKGEPLNGIPRAISVSGMTYQPEAVAGGDMALYHMKAPKEEVKEAAEPTAEAGPEVPQKQNTKGVTPDQVWYKSEDGKMVYLKPTKTYDDLVPLDKLQKRMKSDGLAGKQVMEGKMVVDRVGFYGTFDEPGKSRKNVIFVPHYFIRRYGVKLDDGNWQVYHLRSDGRVQRVGFRAITDKDFIETKPVESSIGAKGAI